MQSLQPSDLVDSSRRYTLEEFWALPEREDPGYYLLIAGILYIVPPPEHPHGHLVSDMTMCLYRFLLNNKVAGYVYFPPQPIYRDDTPTYLEPDMFYVSSEQMRVDHSTADIVFEVVSVSTYDFDRTTKANAYLTFDVCELWLVDPVSMTIEGKADETPFWEITKYSTGKYAKSRVLAGWEVSVDEIFKDLV
jgi:Uma2 family endonuclease